MAGSDVLSLFRPDYGQFLAVVSKSKAGKKLQWQTSADFRTEIGETLCKIGLKPNIKHRRTIENEIQVKKHKGPAQHVIGSKAGSNWPLADSGRKKGLVQVS